MFIYDLLCHSHGAQTAVNMGEHLFYIFTSPLKHNKNASSLYGNVMF